MKADYFSENDEPLQKRIVLEHIGRIDPESIDEYIALGGYETLSSALTEKTPAEILSEIKKSGLRGRGGAGFPTGLKWSFTAPIESERKYLVCNADEGEPGTFKDRLIMEGDPHKLIEGMALAARAISAGKGYIYIRGEYFLAIKRMKKAIESAREHNFLGKNIFDTNFSFDIEIKRGAGAYICGEETALIESIEGHRGHPRTKPPFPGISGLWGYPTVVNNVETLANITPIIKNGAQWFRTFGTDKSPGTKVYTILGRVRNNGLVEVEMGTTLRDIINCYGGGMEDGKKFQAALVGGAAGGFIRPEELDVPLAYETLEAHGKVLGSGAILVLSEDDDLEKVVLNILDFFVNESCGKCVPCRDGYPQLLNMMKNYMGNHDVSIYKRLNHLAHVMAKTSLCALGQSAILPVSSFLK